MHRKTRLTAIGLAGSLLVFATGCPPSDPVDEDEPSIESFAVDPGSITSGDDVQGEVELNWETEDAEAIELLADGDALSLDDCQPLDGADDCTAGGTLTHEPAEDTEYRLNVVSDADAECELDGGDVLNPGLCDSASADITVFPPASLVLDRDDDRFTPGEEFTVYFEVDNAHDFEIGIVDDGELDEVCEVDGDGSCSRADGESGQVTFSGIEESITVSGWAENGAEDGLGDVEVGDVQLELLPEGAPLLAEFDADPKHVDLGDETTLSWETENAAEVEVSSNFDGLLETDLSECSDVADDQGECDVEFTEQDFDGVIVTFSAVAINDEGDESGTLETDVVFRSAPVIESFDADPVEFDDGDDIELSWQTANLPSQLVIEDEDDVVLDTSDDTGDELCDDGCDFDSDSVTIEGLETNTQFTLTASSDLGTDAASVQVVHVDGPQVTQLDVDEQDAFDETIVVEAGSVDLDWDTENADDTELERGDRPEAGCDSGDVSWDDVGDFRGGEDGSYELGDLDQIEECFRLTASDDADQTASATFHIARHPEVNDFDAAPETVAMGDDVTITWETSFATDITVDADNLGAVSQGDLEECTELDEDGNGSCDVQISPGTSADSVEFSIEAAGFDDLTTEEQTAEVFIGTAPSIDDFCASTASDSECDSTTTASDETEDVTLEWTLADDSNVAELTITDQAGEEVEGLDAESGETTIEDVDSTTTWTLEISNDYGTDSADATAFFGPVIDQFDVNGNDAFGGEVFVDTGDVEFVWNIIDADEDTPQLDRADVPGSGDCSDVDDESDWSPLAENADASSSHTEDAVTENGCYRLMAEDDGDLVSSVTVHVIEVPFLTQLETTPDEVDGNDPATVSIDVELTGASSFEIDAVYYDEEDDFIESTTICDDGDAAGDTLDGDSADPKSVTCSHEMDGPCEGLQCVFDDDDPVETTDYLRYEISFEDDEGDGGIEDTEADEDVDVTWD